MSLPSSSSRNKLLLLLTWRTWCALLLAAVAALHARREGGSSGSVAAVVFVESFQFPVSAAVGVGRHHTFAATTTTTTAPRHNYVSSSLRRHHYVKRASRDYYSSSSLPSKSSSSSDDNVFGKAKGSKANVEAISADVDPLILRASNALRATSWLSWWTQLILTVVSSITFVFARNVMDATTGTVGGVGELQKVMRKFFLPGLGIVASTMSIIWTWGQRRLARRFVRRTTSRVEAANLLRRVIKVGTSLNVMGLFTSVLGMQYIVGTLVAKSMSNSFAGFGGGGVGGGIGLVSSQTLQPLDILVVQANTNVLTGHFVSLACLLWLMRMVDLLDPPSLEDE